MSRAFRPGFRWRILAHERTGTYMRAGYTGKMYDRRSGNGPLAPTDGLTPIRYLDGHWEFDELVIDHWFHLEQMGSRDWWIGVGDPANGDYFHINVHVAPDKRVTVRVEDQV